MSSREINTIKLSFNGEVRRIPLQNPISPEGFPFEDLETRIIPTLFTSTKKGKFKISYIDDEDDVVTISSQPELDEAVDQARGMGRRAIRFDITQVNGEKISLHDASETIHHGVCCDGCDASPIIGVSEPIFQDNHPFSNLAPIYPP